MSSSLAQSHLLRFGPINMAARDPRLHLALHTSPFAVESITTLFCPKAGDITVCPLAFVFVFIFAFVCLQMGLSYRTHCVSSYQHLSKIHAAYILNCFEWKNKCFQIYFHSCCLVYSFMFSPYTNLSLGNRVSPSLIQSTLLVSLFIVLCIIQGLMES